MWRLLKFLGHLLKGLIWLVCILLLMGVAVLYLLERGVPEPLLRRLENTISTDDHFIRIERASYDLKRGARIFHVKVMPKRLAGGALATVDEVAVDISLAPFTPLEHRVRSITIKNLSIPTLPPKEKEKKKKPKRKISVNIAPFDLRVERGNILGIKVDSLTAIISTEDTQVNIAGIAIKLPNTKEQLDVSGEVSIDLNKESANGHAQGSVLPENLLPLFHQLKAREAIEQIECFSQFERPIKADYLFDVDFKTTDFAMHLDLDVGPCLYRGVPLTFAKGQLGIYGTNIYTSVIIDNITARTLANAPIAANLAYHEESESLRVDGNTVMQIKPLFNMINVLNHGELDRIKCAQPPTLSATGIVALSTHKSTVTNDLSGKLAIPAGTILNFEVRNATADYQMGGYNCRFYNATAQSPSGGAITGEITFDFPEYNATATVFATAIQLKDVALEEVSHAFNVTNSRAGLVVGTIQLNGPVSEETLHHLCGQGKLKIRDGVINQMRLFAGFTDYLSRNIPGVASLVNQSEGSLDFTIKNGVLHTDNLLLEGSIFSISGRGSYNMVTDKLDFTVRANIFKRKTWLGKITNLITLPFTRLLLEFKVFGSLDDPEWSYINIIEKISDALSSENSGT